MWNITINFTNAQYSIDTNVKYDIVYTQPVVQMHNYEIERNEED